MRPAFLVTSGGLDFTGAYSDHLIALSVSDSAGEESDSLTIELEDALGTILVPEEGATVAVSIGYLTNLRDMGLFTVERVTLKGPPDSITIEAKAAPFDSAGGLVPLQSRKSRSFDATTLGTIIETLANEHGLQAAIDPTLAAVPVPHIDQTNESDMNLLTRIARDAGAVMKPMFGRMVFARRGAGRSISGLALPGALIVAGEHTAYSVTLAKRESYTGVKARWHDNETGETGETETGETVSIPGFGDNIPLVNIGGSSGFGGVKTYEHPHAFASEEEATRASGAYLDTFARRARSASFTMPGRTDLAAEMLVEAVGFRERVNGQWLIKRAEHKIDRGGYATSVECEAPGMAAGGEPSA